jgi:hypothetical protein
MISLRKAGDLPIVVSSYTEHKLVSSEISNHPQNAYNCLIRNVAGVI